MASERTAGLAVYGTEVEAYQTPLTSGSTQTIYMPAPGVGMVWRIYGFSLSNFNSGHADNVVSQTWISGLTEPLIYTSCTNQNIGTPGKQNRWDTSDYWPPGVYLESSPTNTAVLGVFTVTGTSAQLSTGTCTVYGIKARKGS